jgi:hypothetical protein
MEIVTNHVLISISILSLFVNFYLGLDYMKIVVELI